MTFPHERTPRQIRTGRSNRSSSGRSGRSSCCSSSSATSSAPGSTRSPARSPARIGGALWLPFLLAFAVAFITAFSYLELVGKYPRAAGAALYTHKAFGINFLTFMVTFTVMASGVTSAATAAVAFGDDLPAAVRRRCRPGPVAAGFILASSALINFRGVGESVKANVVLTFIELSGLLIIIGVGDLRGRRRARATPSRLDRDQHRRDQRVPRDHRGDLAGVLRDGRLRGLGEHGRGVPRPARGSSRGRCCSGWASRRRSTWSSRCSPRCSCRPTTSPRRRAARALPRAGGGGTRASRSAVFAAIGLFAVVNSALINMLMASRLLYGMANERILPRLFGRVHPERRTPWVAIVFTSVIAIILVGSVDITVLGGTTALLLLGGLHHRQHRGARAPPGPGGAQALPRADLEPLPRDRALRLPRHALCPVGRCSSSCWLGSCWRSVPSCGSSTISSSAESTWTRPSSPRAERPTVTRVNDASGRRHPPPEH